MRHQPSYSLVLAVIHAVFEMQAGVPPNTVAFNAALSACSRCAEWRQALALLRQMQTLPDTAPPNTVR